MGDPVDEPRPPAPGPNHVQEDLYAVELPDEPPRLTPGLARALLSAVRSAAVNAGVRGAADGGEAARLAS